MILGDDKEDPEAYWGIVLCRHGIEYVEDPRTHKRIPTVNRAQYSSIFEDEDYKKAISFAEKLPEKNDIVYAIGAPLGQVNNLTIGRYLGLTSNIPNNNFGFELIYSTAPIDHGNSGGMLLNEDLMVIGMNTAELESDNGVYCGSIPFNELISFIGN